MTVLIWNFILFSLTSTVTRHPVGLPFGAMVPFYLTHLTTYSTPHYLHSQKVFPAVGIICVLFTYQEIRLSFLGHH